MEALAGGRFRVEETLGETVSSTTRRAVDRESGRPVVVKSLRVGPGVDPKAVELLRREARVLANLSHPRVPRFVGLFEEDGPGGKTLDLVTEWVPGRNLAQAIADGKRFTEREVLVMALSLVEVLEYLHGFSPPVIHRDLKPSNVIRRSDGKVFVVDFGGARDRMMQDRSPHGGGTTIVGSYGYMPYEQFEGRAVPASDFYALAMTLVFVLSHKEPSELDKDGMTPRIRGEVNVSEPFLALLERMLAADWRKRPQSAAELREELSRLLGARSRPPARRGPREGVLLASAILFALGGVGLFLATRPVSVPPPGPAPARAARRADAPPARIEARPEAKGEAAPLSTVSLAGPVVARGRLLWDGRPVTATTRVAPTFWFRNETRGTVEGGASRVFPDGRFEVYGLVPGQHGMSVRIDANEENAPILPGDLEAWTQLSTEEGRVADLDVHLAKVVRLLSPQDNGGPMPGWGAECREKPAFPAPVRFEWEPVLPGARYDWEVVRVRCPYEAQEVERSGSTFETAVVVPLAPSGEDEFHLFTLYARKDGRTVGKLMTKGATGHGWDYRFRVAP